MWNPDVGWTSSFSSGAQGVSSDEMQILWARILAGEVVMPGSTSIRTLAILRNLDRSTAQLFRRLCSMATSISLPDGRCLDHRVVSVSGNAASNSLQDFGLSFDTLNILNEYELIIGDYNSWSDVFKACVATRSAETLGWNVPIGFTFQGHSWGLIPIGEREPNQELRVSGVSLTRAGRELSKVVELEPVPQYDQTLQDYFTRNGLKTEQIQPSGERR